MAPAEADELRKSELRVDHYPPISVAERDEQVKNVCRELVEKWSDFDNDKLDVSEISGGITNSLLKVFVKTNPNEAVTVRVFGEDTDIVIDRDRELKTLPYLSAAGFGAKLIGVYETGMVQSFIKARTLDPEGMRNPKISALIAKELRRLHALEVPGSKKPQLWHDIYKFFKKASMLSFEDDDLKREKFSTISFEYLKSEIEMLKKYSDALDAPIIFAHNDLLSGNIMLDDETGTLHFIDFEYGSYSYRGYDIGNHFNEYAGFDCDFNLYPGKDAQYHFYRHYLHPEDPYKASEAELEALYVEANFFALASHLYWGIWSIIQAKFSTIDFDYLGYHFHRLDEYKKRKHEVLDLVSCGDNN